MTVSHSVAAFRVKGQALIAAAAVSLSWPIVASVARADILPGEVTVIAARGNRDSEELAAYYAKARGIPAENVCRLEMPVGDVCARQEWSEKIRPAIREWLAEHDPNGRLRCLVTVWGVPLKIGPAELGSAQRRYAEFLTGERQARLKLLRDAIAEFDLLAPAGAISTHTVGGQSSTGSPLRPNVGGGDSPADELNQLRTQLEAALAAAQARLAELPAGAPKTQAQARLQQLVTLAGGVGVVVQNLEQQVRGQPSPDPTVAAEYHRLRGAVAAWGEARTLLEQRPPGIERDLGIIAITERMGGLLAVMPWLDEQIATVNKNETGASFDSELALVLWPEDYELLRWQPNYLRRQYDDTHLQKAHPTLMTARLDAPTAELARGLVDAALAAEREGLRGKAYFDARGVAKLDDPPAKAGSVADYDRAILLTADGMKKRTSVEVVLNAQPQLFQPGECPEAALYCGWYSLAKYVDAFDWQQGAVAYHIASFEAESLHDAGSQQWCKRLIEDGVAATLGPVQEPYLQAFPRPDEFFAMLLRGDLSLAECYWYSQPYASWNMALLGDPMYQPYRGRSPVKAGEESVLRGAGR
jgi:uncharacterized protein (TIGR03790 family)